MAFLNSDAAEPLHAAVSTGLRRLYQLENTVTEQKDRSVLAQDVRDLLLDMYGKIRHLSGQLHAIEAMGEMGIQARRAQAE